MGRHKTAPADNMESPRLLNQPSDNNGGNNNSNNEYGKKYEFSPDFEGPVKNRSCTDVLCLIPFLAFLGGWGFVAYIGISQGDINKVIYPTDSLGRVCGAGELESRPYLLFFDLTKCLNPAVLTMGCSTPQVCVEKCPDETSSGYSLASSGQEGLAKQKMKPFCQLMADKEWNQHTAKDLIKLELCPAWVLNSRPIIGRCLPVGTGITNTSTIIQANQTTENTAISSKTLTSAISQLGAFLNLRDFGERVFNDLSETWWMICLAYLGCSVLSFLWILLMRCFAGIMVWTSIGLVFLLVTGLLGYSTYRYILVKDVAGSILEVNLTPNYLEDVLSLRDTWLAFLIILAILAIIILLILIALRTRILIAIGLVEEGSKSVGQNLGSIFFPVVPFVFHVLVVAVFAAIAMYLSSCGTSTYRIHFNETQPACGDGKCINPDTKTFYQEDDACTPEVFNTTCDHCPGVQCQFTKYEKSTLAFGLQWFNLFALYWSVNFVSSFGELVLAGVFATWYWTWDKSKVPCCVLGKFFGIAVVYHLGTLAFGSLIIAVIQFVRAVLSWVETKLKAFNNDVTKCLLCCCKCCLWCLEKFMRFINRNAYIVCAMKSTNFCTSAQTAFNLLMRNIVRVVVLNKVVAFLLFLGKVAIVAGVGTMSYFVFSRQIPDLAYKIPTLNYFFMPVIFIVIGSYFITSSFFGVYSMAVDTLFLCFLEDLERNDGSPERPFFMSKNLMRVVGKMQKFNESHAMQSPRRQ